MKSTVAGDRLTRFSDRVEDYIKYRPGYPKQVADLLLGSLDETSDLAVVDLGSGTGKLTQRFLERKLRTFAVEPNPEMREAAEALFAGDRLFMSVDATAEDTGLEDGIADLIVIGQALHWFDLGKVRDECCRLLKKDAKAKVAVVYNERKLLSPMLADYETFLHTHARSYQTVGHRNVDGSVFHSFFGPAGYEVHVFQNSQSFDFAGLVGRYCSSSYAFKEGDQAFAAAKEALYSLFRKYETRGRVSFDYETRVYLGTMV